MESVYDIEIIFGENRKFNFRKWKGKERRELTEAQSKEELNDKKLADIFVYGCMENPSYLNQEEILYTIHILRKASFGTDIVIPFECECGHSYDVVISDESDFKNIILDDIKDIHIDNVTFRIKEPNLTLDIMDSYRDLNQLEQLYHEMLFYIDSYEVEDQVIDAFTYADLDNFFDKVMDVKYFDECLKQFSNMRFQFSPEVSTTCEKCNNETLVIVDYIEEIM